MNRTGVSRPAARRVAAGKADHYSQAHDDWREILV
jgi:hypothetical protein